MKIQNLEKYIKFIEDKNLMHEEEHRSKYSQALKDYAAILLDSSTVPEVFVQNYSVESLSTTNSSDSVSPTVNDNDNDNETDTLPRKLHCDIISPN